MLLDQLNDDLKQAMRDRDRMRMTTIRGLKSAIDYYAIEKKLEDISDDDVLTVIRKQVKQRQDAIALYEQGDDADRAAAEKAEMTILQTYLPAQADDDTIRETAVRLIEQHGATDRKQMGLIIKETVAALEGAADGKRVSGIVGSLLGG